jgi:gliding motility-associated lipoprotein GldH
MRRYLNIFVCLIIISFLTCCAKNEIYDKTYSFSGDSWKYDEPVDFEFTVPDTSRSYDIYLHIRNSGSYSYSNIWLFLEVSAPNGNVLKDTLEIILADNAGRWLGKGIWNVNEMQVPYKHDVFFINRGIYQLSVQHAMRDSTLEGIMNVGLRMQYHN